ncbi:DUF2591 family protein [Yersinia enterocolitica]|uniref:Protein of uncharacterized function (DUF2591) n=1 Tax=Yersinia intermedia TaxID=631 RepID=A0A0T9LS39_YERIN|nr:MULTISPECIES: phage protein NinX family protein [Yersinia]ELI8121003.1 DUF2591 family protein [Yersinia enterocolitica]ELI8387105.1 DUF2591 family protein [Yersinia enterocolitica]CNF19204.1 Protein of uncharacterised function (DUF2591) [Yersinia intermedia]CNJ37607.1 Protein of uncharacterised function (DUF2591) [Yersinia rohdei]CQJ65657.1 Protein of uncharacterised function (DUF2591) [Yersinia enterocolitica]
MKDYSAMSDFEINKAVAIHLGMKPFDEETGWQGLTKEPYVDVVVRGAGRLGGFNSCNKAADAWPIIVENKISLNWSETEKLWCAHVGGVMTEGCWCWDDDPSHHHDDSNPLRAAMIVFLMMKYREADNGKAA